MNELVRAALAPYAGWFLLVEPSPSLVMVLARRERVQRVIVLYRKPRAARRCRGRLEGEGPAHDKTSVVVGVLEDVPFARASFDAVLCAAGLPSLDEPISTLSSLRQLVRPGGSVLVVSRMREGTVGSVSSLLRSAIRRQRLPLATDLTAWMLYAGMRSVRQANVYRTVVPTTLTWARARQRPREV